MATYESPKITELGAVQDLTLNVYKPTGRGDIVYIGGVDVGEGGPPS